VDDCDLDAARLGAELRLGILGDEGGKRLAVLVGMDLGAEDVLQVLVLEHGGRDCGRDPENLLVRLDLGGERHRVCAGIDAVDDLHLLLADQTLDLVDRDIDLALAIGVDGYDLVFAGDPAALVDEINGDLGADRARHRPAGGERAGKVIDDTDADRLSFGAGQAPGKTQRGSGSGRALEQRSTRCSHGVIPLWCWLLVGARHSASKTRVNALVPRPCTQSILREEPKVNAGAGWTMSQAKIMLSRGISTPEQCHAATRANL
jgi:hypothetical protein